MPGPVGMVRVDLAQHGGQLLQQHIEQPHFPHQKECGQRVPAAQRLRELLGDARRGGLHEFLAVPEDRLVRVRRDRKAEAARELDGAHHAHRVFLEADVRISDRADQPGREVLETSDVVDHREARDVVEEAVDREVAPQRVLARRAERIVLGL